MVKGVSRALLIAAPQPGLEFVRRDTSRIKEALLGSGYPASAITVLDAEEQTTGNGIVVALDTFLTQCQDNDFALVYFSGHGVRKGDADFLVPSDADTALRSLIKVAPNELLERLRSTGTVMLCLDACRDEADPDFGTPPPTEVSPQRRNVVLVQACVAGERAMGTADGSFMGRALAEALSPDTPWRTVAEVIAHVKRRTEEIARDNGSRHPVEVSWLGSPLGDPPAEPSRREICESGPGDRGWTAAMHESPLWGRVNSDDVATGRLKDRISLLIDKTLRIRHDANRERKAGRDPWEDPQFPERLLTQLHRLVPESPEGRLSSLEVVALLATPFVREAAVSCSRRTLAEIYPAAGPSNDEHESPGRDGAFRGHLRHDMEDVRRAYRQIDAKRHRLRDTGAHAAAVAAEQWLRHRLLADWDQLWYPDAGPVVGALESMTDVLGLLTDAAEYAAFLEISSKPTRRNRLRDALLQVTSQMHTRPSAKAPDGRPWEDQLAARLMLPDTTSWRPAHLAGLLHMAELLAIDPRMLDGIVVDHLGDDDAVVDPARIAGGLDDGGFAPSGGHGWGLVFECPGAALHVALDRQAHVATAAAQDLRDAHRGAPLFARLPRHIGTGGMEPRDGRYKSPPPRFQLAEDGVKPLIMGTQLYGDHMLALRELYQNALDACRRRHARQRYAATIPQEESGLRPGTPVKELDEYTVSFVLGRDEHRRIYLECVDNGIGMTEEELDTLFSRAGRRFEQSPHHVRELRRWRRKGVKPELNSRFGIGVFSYFMLAETIEVTTRPAGESGFGSGGVGHHVHVTSDSGLMHTSTDRSMEAGTRVRLHLRPEFAEAPPSVIKILREQIWHTPVRLRVEDRLTTPHDPDEWEPGILKSITPVVPQESIEGPWWVRGRGARLVDGIFVGDDRRPHGYVVNLRRRHVPDLSVNRNRLQGFADGMVRQDLAQAVDALRLWDPIPLDWLWNLVKDDARIGEIVLRRMLSSGVRVTFDKWHGRIVSSPSHSVALASIGCLPADEGPNSVSSTEVEEITSSAYFFRCWRSQLVERPGQGRRSRSDRAVIGYPAGFPEPTALDGLLFRDMPSARWSPTAAALRAAADGGHDLRTVTRALRRYAVAGVPVPEVDNVPRLADLTISPLLAELDEAYTIRSRYAATLRSLEPPAHAPLLLVAGRHGKTLREIAELVVRLRTLHPEIPEPPELGELAQHIPDQQELAVLRAEQVPELNALPEVVTPPVAAFFAKQLGIEPAAVAAIVRRYERFGFRMSGDLSGVRFLDGDESALGLTFHVLTVKLLAQPSISLLRLVRLSAMRGDPTVASTTCSIREIAKRLGLRMDDPSDGPLASVMAPSWWAALPQEDESAAGPLSTWTVLRVLWGRPEPESVEDDVGAVMALAAAGLVRVETVEAVRTWWRTPAHERPELLVDEDRSLRFRGSGWDFSAEYDATSNRVDTLFLVILAAHLRTTVGDTADAVRQEAEPYGIDVALVPEETRGLRPHLHVVEALCTRWGQGWKTEVTRREIVTYARECGVAMGAALSELRAYEPLGAPTLPTVAAPSGEVPSQALDATVRTALEELLQFEPLSCGGITPLKLTITAVRMGLGLGETYRALASYSELGLSIDCPMTPVPTPDDTYAPDWRDVVILTERLTGNEPALSGKVSEDHIRLAAEETGLDVFEVHRRLNHYAPLFGYHVASGEADRTAAAEKESM
ncbi:GTP-binding protein [Streptomyces coelicoflavus]|uniref:GTP-binding protein n=1 Tax=Streptomyces coelicoflavus TaxID=285562 RepID=A0A7K3PDU5_9ACTN|nr:caspase family protein [Streptomyces coelicoflavus]NEB08077.1 GTP-binding protein [Streptomyces coelicoflavus]